MARHVPPYKEYLFIDVDKRQVLGVLRKHRLDTRPVVFNYTYAGVIDDNDCIIKQLRVRISRVKAHLDCFHQSGYGPEELKVWFNPNPDSIIPYLLHERHHHRAITIPTK